MYKMSCEARKISGQDENFIDNFLIDMCEPTSVNLRKFNISPNQITTVGLIVGLLSFYCILKKHYVLAFALFWLSYYLDCLDGYMARKYNMATTFGDFYDHFRDIFILFLIVGAIWVNLNDNEKIIFSLVLALSIFGMIVHLGCQEQNSVTHEHNHSLRWLKKLCPDKRMICTTKYFGCGVLTLIVSLYILYLKYK